MMHRITLAIAIALILVGCSSSGSVGGTPTTDATSSGVPVELRDHEVRQVTVGDRTLTLAVADSPQLRAQGLMGVTDLGDLDGMLFYWRHEAGGGGFWMKDTLIPLDIVWFLADGSFAGRSSMEPCVTDVCPTYKPGNGIDYRFAIEAEPGDLDWITDDTVIVYSD